MDELIKALRWCGSEDERHEMCVDESYRCPMWNEDRITDECKAELMRDAADALEAAEKMIEELENALAACEVSAMNNEELITELRCCAESMPWCGSCIYRGKNDGISELLNKAADALEATERKDDEQQT